MPQSEELQAMKRELLAAIAAVDAKVERVDARVGRIEAKVASLDRIDVATLDIVEKVNILCERFLAPGEQRALKQAGSGR